jgi:RND superfamily putative drug exporter
VPLFLFVILFGLSMDYHVFVVSSIREEHEAGLGAVAAARRGTLRSAGVITGAATVMVTVAAIFGLLPELSMKETGTGLAVAVSVDSGLVRVVLLPALISVLGERVWRVPRWLRWLPQHTTQAAVPTVAVPGQDERPVAPVAEA